MTSDSSDDIPPKKARVMKASHLLQSKVGFGEVDEKVVEKSELVIEAPRKELNPLADGYLDDLKNLIAEYKQGGKDGCEDFHERIIEPVMLLKGNAAMSDYVLIGNLANIMLNFLETIEKMDDDVIQIAEALHATLNRIFKDDMRGSGDEIGQQFEKELQEACRRYFAKNGLPTDNPLM